MRRHQPEPGGEAGRRRASRRSRRSPTRASPARPPARSPAGADVVFLCARARRVVAGSRPRCSTPVPGWWWISRPTSGSATPRSTQRYYGAHAAPELVHRFLYGLADVLGTALRGARAHRRARAASPPRPSSRSIRSRRARHRRRAVALRGDRVERRRRAAQGPRRTIRRGRTISSPTRCWATGTRREVRASSGGSGPAAPTRRPGSWPTRGRSCGASTSRCTPSSAAPRSRRRVADSAACWYRDAYAGRPFVRVLEAPPELTHAVGTNYALIHAAASEDGREMQVIGRDRQPDQGRRRAGGAGDEPGARARGDGGAAWQWGCFRAEGAGTQGRRGACCRVPYAQTPASGLRPVPVRPVRGHGSWLVDEDGQRVARRLRRPRGRLDRPQPSRTWCAPSRSRRRRCSSTPPRCRTRCASELAERLAAQLSRDPLERVFFCNSGRGGQRERAAIWPGSSPAASTIVSVAGGWHGRTAATPRGDRRREVRGGRPPARDAARRARCPFDDVGRDGARGGRARVAAVIVEPVQGLTGARDCSPRVPPGRPPRLRRARRGADLRRGPVRRRPLRRVHRGRGVRGDARRAHDRQGARRRAFRSGRWSRRPP